MIEKLKNRKTIYMALSLILVLGLSLVLTACGEKKEEEPETVAVEEETHNDMPPNEYVAEMSELERGKYYLETEQGYIEPYTGYLTNDNSVFWFNERTWENIPTLYKGQHIVYRLNTDFQESFRFTRFFDEGYTVGIANMTKTATGRYKVNVGAESYQLNPESDAKRLSELGEVNITLESLGGSKIRSDRVSSATGSVTGLTQNEAYDAEIYIGTEKQKDYTLIADARTLYIAQTNSTSDYQFIRAEIILIDIPDYFESGYYSVNGSGIFRYVNGTTYNDNTDFNIMNANDARQADMQRNTQRYSIDWVQSLTYDDMGSYVLVFEYDNNVNEDLLPEDTALDQVEIPYLKVNTGGSEPIRLYDDNYDGVISGTFNALEGTYPMNIYNLYGRTYSYSLMYDNANLDANMEYVDQQPQEEAPVPTENSEDQAVLEEMEAEVRAQQEAEKNGTMEQPSETEPATQPPNIMQNAASLEGDVMNWTEDGYPIVGSAEDANNPEFFSSQPE